MIDREEVNRKSFFREKNIIKWYQYQYVKNEDSDTVADTTEDIQAETSNAPEEAFDDEVARIMASFRDAKQSSVDKLFENL